MRFICGKIVLCNAASGIVFALQCNSFLAHPCFRFLFQTHNPFRGWLLSLPAFQHRKFLAVGPLVAILNNVRMAFVPPPPFQHRKLPAVGPLVAWQNSTRSPNGHQKAGRWVQRAHGGGLRALLSETEHLGKSPGYPYRLGAVAGISRRLLRATVAALSVFVACCLNPQTCGIRKIAEAAGRFRPGVRPTGYSTPPDPSGQFSYPEGSFESAARESLDSSRILPRR